MLTSFCISWMSKQTAFLWHVFWFFNDASQCFSSNSTKRLKKWKSEIGGKKKKVVDTSPTIVEATLLYSFKCSDWSWQFDFRRIFQQMKSVFQEIKDSKIDSSNLSDWLNRSVFPQLQNQYILSFFFLVSFFFEKKKWMRWKALLRSWTDCEI